MTSQQALEHARLTRRRVCALLALAGGSAVLAGCGGSSRASSGPGGSSGRGPMLPPRDDGGTWTAGGSGSSGSAGSTTAGREALERFRRQSGGAVAGVIPRRDWTRSGPVMSRAKTLPSVTRITVHHDGMTAFRTTSKQSAMARIESIRRAHVRQGWADIGYHYVIDPAGRVYEARSTRLQGAHVKYNNEQNLGILVLGNYNSQPVTSETRAALDSFIASQMRRYGVPVGRVQTHQEIRPTACPGRSLQAQMNDARATRGALRRA